MKSAFFLGVIFKIFTNNRAINAIILSINSCCLAKGIGIMVKTFSKLGIHAATLLLCLAILITGLVSCDYKYDEKEDGSASSEAEDVQNTEDWWNESTSENPFVEESESVFETEKAPDSEGKEESREESSVENIETLQPTETEDDFEKGELGDPELMLPEDTPKKSPPEDPEISLWDMSKKKYLNGILGCEKITVLSEYNVGIDYDINSYKDERNKVFYLFLPCRADLSKITFSVTHMNRKSSGPYTVDFSDSKITHNELVTVENGQYVIIAMQSNLPTMMIQVDESYGTLDEMYADEFHNTYVYGEMITSVTDEMAIEKGWVTRYASVDEESAKHCSMKMRGRGNATWVDGYTKLPYQIKTENDLDLLGMGVQDTFVLLANFNDASHLRNRLALEFGAAIGSDYTSQSRHVDLFINGEYMGLYLLAEKCEVGENRIEIDKKDDFLYEVNQRYQEYGDFGFLSNFDGLGKIRLHSPETRADMWEAKSVFYEAERALYSLNEEMFLEFYDLESWAKMYLIQELTMNHDAYWGSFYFYYDRTDGKLHACAPWDFDFSLGVSWADQNNATAKDSVENPKKYSVDSHYIIKAMIRYPSFKQAVKDVYYSSETQRALGRLLDVFDEMAEENRRSAKMNFIGSTYLTDYYPYEYDGAVEYLRDKLAERMKWLDRKIAKF